MSARVEEVHYDTAVDKEVEEQMTRTPDIKRTTHIKHFLEARHKPTNTSIKNINSNKTRGDYE